MAAVADAYRKRREQVRKLLIARKIDGLLIASVRNVTWLTGFTGDSTWLLITPDSETLVSDFRFVTQISEECPGVHAAIRTSSQTLHELVSEVCRNQGVESCGFEGHVMSCDSAAALQLLPFPQHWMVVSGEVEQLRSIKDKEEIAEIRGAIRQAERSFDYFKAILTPQITEIQLAAELEHAMRGFGAVGCSFPAIVAVGDRAALPHYRPGDIPVSSSPILLLDWGARNRSGYHSDLTRTMLTRKTDKTFEKVYRTVLQAQQLAIEKISPGVTAGDVDKAARDFIHKAGYGKNFDHGTGHGIGLDVHELPRVSRNSETVLKPGMVVTVEPGIYLPGWGGVRIEDDVLVTRSGCEVLSSVPKDWESVMVSC